MTDRSLWTSYVGAPGVFTAPTNYTEGVNFVPSVDGLVTALRWYRAGTGTGYLPSRLSLWNRSNGNKIAEVVSPTDNNTVGWKEFALASPAALAQGLTYTVAEDRPTGTTGARIAVGTRPTPDANLALPTDARSVRVGSLNLYPNVESNDFMEWLDVVFSDSGTGPPPAPPATTTSTDAALASWLTLGAGNDHVGQLPNQTYEELTDTTTGLPGILTAVAAVASNVTTEIARTAGLVGGTVQSAINAGFATADVVIQSFRTAFDVTAAHMVTIKDQMAGTVVPVASGPQGMAADTDPGWTEVDSGAFSGPFTVLERCDRVYVHITTVGAANTTYTSDSWEFGSFAWPWYPLLANMIGRHRTSRAREAVLYEPGMRMDGVLVQLPADFEGTYSAVRFDG